MRTIDANSVSIPAAGNVGAKLAPVNFVSRLLVSLPLVIAAGDCLFGFVSTFEPMPRAAQWLWRAAYIFGGAGSVLAIAWLWLKPRQR
jgi:hypothetical protein